VHLKNNVRYLKEGIPINNPETYKNYKKLKALIIGMEWASLHKKYNPLKR
jgi:hypothetical protein